MAYSDSFFIDIKKIHLAHQYILNRVHKCAYPKGREQYGLVYAIRGKAEYRCFSGQRFTLRAGGLLFLSPDAAYSIAAEKDFEHFTVNFSIHEETSNLAALSHPYCLIQDKKSDQPERVFRHLVEIWQKKRSGYEMQAMGILYELLSLFYSEYIVQNTALFHRLLPAREYVERHFAEAICLEKLAALCNMSVTNFRREWKKHYPESPMQYRDLLRIYYAKEYLRSGYYTIYEIAEKCGFEDPSYFSRFFKKQTGLTPGEAKKQYFGT